MILGMVPWTNKSKDMSYQLFMKFFHKGLKGLSVKHDGGKTKIDKLLWNDTWKINMGNVKDS